jgi:hypothetical protein
MVLSGIVASHMKGEVTMNVISELDTLCIVARELYGERGAVLASEPIDEEPQWFLVVEREQTIGEVPGPRLGLEAAEIVHEAP